LLIVVGGLVLGRRDSVEAVRPGPRLAGWALTVALNLTGVAQGIELPIYRSAVTHYRAMMQKEDAVNRTDYPRAALIGVLVVAVIVVAVVVQLAGRSSSADVSASAPSSSAADFDLREGLAGHTEYLRELNRAGIGYPSIEYAWQMGATVCRVIAARYTDPAYQAALGVLESENPGLSRDNRMTVMAAAVHNICPDQVGQLP